MSITFFVKNKKKFLVGLAPVMSVEEALRLVPNLSQFNADEDDEEFDAEGFYGAKLDELDCLVVGTDGLSGRGFEIGYADGAYNVHRHAKHTHGLENRARVPKKPSHKNG